MEAILEEWEAFAATLLPAAEGLDSRALRDHAQHILTAIAKDLNQPQTAYEQSEKSKGLTPEVLGATDTAAQTHAVLRARIGFDINQLVAEYRALRATVLRLWMNLTVLDQTGIEDMLRFNEAIDQAVAESVSHFQLSVDRHRNLFLGMLGHDMRNPLNCIVMTASYLAELSAGEHVSRASQRLIRSGASMQALLDDLTDLSRTNLGLGIRVDTQELDLAEAAEDELDQFRAAHPSRQIEFTASGNTHGSWDGARVQQVLRNLVSNALAHGAPEWPVRVALRGEPKNVWFEVSNRGQIDPARMQQMFEPLRRGTEEHSNPQARQGLGLGLFIVREIAKAHGGDVEARCEGNHTTFAVRLPRAA
jgi:signal transduction histidine kinase